MVDPTITNPVIDPAKKDSTAILQIADIYAGGAKKKERIDNPAMVPPGRISELEKAGVYPYEIGSLKKGQKQDWAPLTLPGHLYLLRKGITDVAEKSYNGKLVSLNELVNGRDLIGVGKGGLYRVFQYTNEASLTTQFKGREATPGKIDLKFIEERFKPARAILEKDGLKDGDSLKDFKFDTKNPQHMFILTNMVTATVWPDYEPYDMEQMDDEVRKKKVPPAPPIPETPPPDVSQSAINGKIIDYKKVINDTIKENTNIFGAAVGALYSGEIAVDTSFNDYNFHNLHSAYLRWLKDESEVVCRNLGLETKRNVPHRLTQLREAMVASWKEGTEPVTGRNSKPGHLPHEYYWTPETAAYYKAFVATIKPDAYYQSYFAQTKPNRSNSGFMAAKKEEYESAKKTYDRMVKALEINETYRPAILLRRPDINQEVIKFLNAHVPALIQEPLKDGTDFTDKRYAAGVLNLNPSLYKKFEETSGVKIDALKDIYSSLYKDKEIKEITQDINIANIKALQKFINKEMVGPNLPLNKAIPEDGNATTTEFAQALTATTKYLQTKIKDSLENKEILARVKDYIKTAPNGTVGIVVPKVKQSFIDPVGVDLFVPLRTDGSLEEVVAQNLETGFYYGRLSFFSRPVECAQNPKTGKFHAIDRETGKLLDTEIEPIKINPTLEAIRILRIARIEGPLVDFGKMLDGLPPAVIQGMAKKSAGQELLKQEFGIESSNYTADEVIASEVLITMKKTLHENNALFGIAEFDLSKAPDPNDPAFAKSLHDALVNFKTFAGSEKGLKIFSAAGLTKEDAAKELIRFCEIRAEHLKYINQTALKGNRQRAFDDSTVAAAQNLRTQINAFIPTIKPDADIKSLLDRATELTVLSKTVEEKKDGSIPREYFEAAINLPESLKTLEKTGQLDAHTKQTIQALLRGMLTQRPEDGIALNEGFKKRANLKNDKDLFIAAEQVATLRNLYTLYESLPADQKAALDKALSERSTPKAPAASTTSTPDIATDPTTVFVSTPTSATSDSAPAASTTPTPAPAGVTTPVKPDAPAATTPTPAAKPDATPSAAPKSPAATATPVIPAPITPAATTSTKKSLPPDVVERIKDLQRTMGRVGDKVTGIYDAETQDYVSQILATAHDTHMEQFDKEIKAADGNLYKIAADGTIIPEKEGKYERTPEDKNLRDAKDPGRIHSIAHHVLITAFNTDDSTTAFKVAKLAEFEKEQRKIIAQIAGENADTGKILNELQQLTKDKTKASAFMNNVRRDGLDNTQYSDLMTRLWVLEANRKKFEDNPDFSDIINNKTGYARFHSLAAAMDVVGYFATGKITNTLDGMKPDRGYDPTQNVAIDDRFFKPEVYDLLRENKPVSARLVGLDRDGFASRADIAELAAREFVRDAAELGIAKKVAPPPAGTKLPAHITEIIVDGKPEFYDTSGITKAMFKGEFNPYFEDLRLVHEGMRSNVSMNDIKPQVYNNLVNAGHVKNGEMPDKIYLIGTFMRVRSTEWNSRFGSLENMGKIDTMINGKIASVTPQDLALRYHMRICAGHFSNDYGGILDRDADMRYEDAIKALQTAGKQNLADELKMQVEDILKNRSAFSYYDNSSMVKGSPFNLYKDYMDTRNNKYIPRQKEIALGIEKTVNVTAPVPEDQKVKPPAPRLQTAPPKTDPKGDPKPAADAKTTAVVADDATLLTKFTEQRNYVMAEIGTPIKPGKNWDTLASNKTLQDDAAKLSRDSQALFFETAAFKDTNTLSNETRAKLAAFTPAYNKFRTDFDAFEKSKATPAPTKPDPAPAVPEPKRPEGVLIGPTTNVKPAPTEPVKPATPAAAEPPKPNAKKPDNTAVGTKTATEDLKAAVKAREDAKDKEIADLGHRVDLAVEREKNRDTPIFDFQKLIESGKLNSHPELKTKAEELSQRQIQLRELNKTTPKDSADQNTRTNNLIKFGQDTVAFHKELEVALKPATLTVVDKTKEPTTTPADPAQSKPKETTLSVVDSPGEPLKVTKTTNPPTAPAAPPSTAPIMVNPVIVDDIAKGSLTPPEKKTRLEQLVDDGSLNGHPDLEKEAIDLRDRTLWIQDSIKSGTKIPPETLEKIEIENTNLLIKIDNRLNPKTSTGTKAPATPTVVNAAPVKDSTTTVTFDPKMSDKELANQVDTQRAYLFHITTGRSSDFYEAFKDHRDLKAKAYDIYSKSTSISSLNSALSRSDLNDSDKIKLREEAKDYLKKVEELRSKADPLIKASIPKTKTTLNPADDVKLERELEDQKNYLHDITMTNNGKYQSTLKDNEELRDLGHKLSGKVNLMSIGAGSILRDKGFDPLLKDHLRATMQTLLEDIKKFREQADPLLNKPTDAPKANQISAEEEKMILKNLNSQQTDLVGWTVTNRFKNNETAINTLRELATKANDLVSKQSKFESGSLSPAEREKFLKDAKILAQEYTKFCIDTGIDPKPDTGSSMSSQDKRNNFVDLKTALGLQPEDPLKDTDTGGGPRPAVTPGTGIPV